jgi:hypothetical protein
LSVSLDSTTAAAFESKSHDGETRNPKQETRNTDSWQKNGGQKYAESGVHFPVTNFPANRLLAGAHGRALNESSFQRPNSDGPTDESWHRLDPWVGLAIRGITAPRTLNPNVAEIPANGGR